jgi:hypothetical protein
VFAYIKSALNNTRTVSRDPSAHIAAVSDADKEIYAARQCFYSLLTRRNAIVPISLYHPRFSRRSFTFLCSRNRLVSENRIYDGSEPHMFSGTGVKSPSVIRHCGLESRASRRTQTGFRSFWLRRRICHWTSTSTLSGSQVRKISPCSLYICPALANSASAAYLRW